MQTCVALTMGQVFRPEDKWGPLSGMMKITPKVRPHAVLAQMSTTHFHALTALTAVQSSREPLNRKASLHAQRMPLLDSQACQ